MHDKFDKIHKNVKKNAESLSLFHTKNSINTTKTKGYTTQLNNYTVKHLFYGILL